jgi:hypothetical protein
MLFTAKDATVAKEEREFTAEYAENFGLFFAAPSAVGVSMNVCYAGPSAASLSAVTFSAISTLSSSFMLAVE